MCSLSGISAFTVISALAVVAFAGYCLFLRDAVDKQLAFGLCVSLLLVNLQAMFVLGACTAPLAENFANEIMSIYEDIIDEMLTSECTSCMETEDIIQSTMVDANSQNYGAEAAYCILSVVQVGGCNTQLGSAMSLSLHCNSHCDHR